MFARQYIAPSAPNHPDILRHFGAFHGEIRSALRRVAQLASECHDSSHTRKRARVLSDFFAGPLLWHDIDEEALLAPALRALRIEFLDDALDECKAQHEQMEEALAEILFHLEDVAAARSVADSERLKQAAAQLTGVLIPHLIFEEDRVFPIARDLLSSEAIEHLGAQLLRREKSRQARLPRPE